MTDTATGDAPEAAAETKGNPRLRRILLLILFAVVVVAALAWLLFRVVLAPPSEKTDDAYVAGDVIAITARSPGTVMALHADDTERVLAGAPLVDLDPAMADVELAAAEAELGRSVRAIRTDFARLGTSRAAVTEASARLAQAKADLARRKVLADTGAISGEELAHAEDAVTVARAALSLAKSTEEEARSTVSGTDITTNPAVRAAIAAYRRAAIQRAHMHIVAPAAGVVAKRQAQLGQHIAAGAPLMVLVPLDRVWIDANFRETQLKDVRIGQPVKAVSDIYGGSVVYHGRVAGLDAGSGDAFALLPPQNASGNWIKITQRLPVRVELDPKDLADHPLRLGLSMTVTIDTSDRSGPRLARPGAMPYHSDISNDPDDAAVTARIRQIIAANR